MKTIEQLKKAKLSGSEINIVREIYANRGNILSYDEISEIYGGKTNPVILMSKINKKIRAEYGESNIHNVSGKGYIFFN